LTAKLTDALTTLAATIEGTSAPVNAVSASSMTVSTANAMSDEPANSRSGSMMRSESAIGRKWLDAFPSRYTVSMGTSRVATPARRQRSSTFCSYAKRSPGWSRTHSTMPAGMPRSPVCVSLRLHPAASRKTPRATALPARERTGTRPLNARQPSTSVGVPPAASARSSSATRRMSVTVCCPSASAVTTSSPGCSRSTWANPVRSAPALPRLTSWCSTVAPSPAVIANTAA